jgi:hypothetical protein
MKKIVFLSTVPNTSPIKTVLPIYMKYTMTQCADVWGYPQGATTTPQVFFNTYFTNNNIGATYKSIFHDPNLVAVCAACTCSSGSVLYIEATQAAVAQLTQMGFVQCSSVPRSNVLWGDWLYVRKTGGFAGVNEDIRNLNHHLVFAGNQVTLREGNNPPTTRTYSIVPPNPNSQYDNGIAYDNNTIAQDNFMIRNDSLFIGDVAADGFHFILERQ